MLEILVEGALISSAICLYAREFTKKNKKEESIPEKMDELFEVCNLYVKRDKTIIKPIVANYRPNEYLVYILPVGMSEDDFIRRKNEIKTLLNTQIEIEIKGRRLTIHMYDLKKYNYELPEDWEEKTEKMLIPLIVGKSYKGYEIIDLADCPHVKIGGTTRRGKSNLIHLWIHMLLKHAKVPIELKVIDLKRVDFAYLKNHIVFAHEIGKTQSIIHKVHEEMERRKEIFDNYGINNIRDYKGKEELPYIVLIVDEISQISPVIASKKDKQVKERIHGELIDIVCLSGALGIHVILSTQRPDKDIMPGQIKANLPCSIAFKCVNTVNSQIILDNDLAAQIPDIKGRAILQFEKQVEVQVPHLPFKEAKRRLLEDDHAR